MVFHFVSIEAAMEVVFTNGETTQSNVADNQPSIAGTNIAAAVTDVTSATETLAESIVDSILQPAMCLTGSSAITLPTSDADEADNQIQQQGIEDQEMEHVPVEVQDGVGEAPDFSELTTGLLSSLSEILPSVTAAQRALSGVGHAADTESYPEASYESSYPNSASSLDSTQLGSMLAQSCNTVTPAPTSSYNREDGEDGDETRSPPQGPVSTDREHAEGDYDSESSNLNPACGPPPPLIPLEEVVNMDVAEAADEEEDDEEDEDVPVSYPRRNPSQTLLESIRRAGHAPQNLQDALDMFAFESTGRLINEMEDTSDISGLGIVREVEGVQASISNGVRHPVNGSESLDLEAAASWLRSQVEARVSQHQREGEVPEESPHLPLHYEESRPQVDSVNLRSASAFENR
jgi:hypothetical protein